MMTISPNTLIAFYMEMYECAKPEQKYSHTLYIEYYTIHSSETECAHQEQQQEWLTRRVVKQGQIIT